MKQLALIGPTASGKSALALDLACKFDAYILSLDSLSVYKEIDIASAKPSKSELQAVRHFGIDEIYPNEHFNAALFFKLYAKAKSECKKESKNLIIVGGTGFYLYALTNGLSDIPQISSEALQKAAVRVSDLADAYKMLREIDLDYSSKISSNDTYRIQKAYEIYYETGKSPTQIFASSLKKPLCPGLSIFEISRDRADLREQIKKRTRQMFDDGLLTEVETLIKKYGREPKCMNTIGISEVIDYLDGKTTIDETMELISIHTGQLAKRQETFNRGKFKNSIKQPLKELEVELENFLKN